MPVITLTTVIHAPVEAVFNLARSIDLHQQSMAHTNEKAIAGRRSGLIEKGETVTWQARHLFRTRTLTSAITHMDVPLYFRDVMLKGDFKVMEHDHYFSAIPEGTLMKDVFYFKAPFGILGRMVEWIFLTRYMKRLLEKRNEIIRQCGEAK